MSAQPSPRIASLLRWVSWGLLFALLVLGAAAWALTPRHPEPRNLAVPGTYFALVLATLAALGPRRWFRVSGRRRAALMLSSAVVLLASVATGLPGRIDAVAGAYLLAVTIAVGAQFLERSLKSARPLLLTTPLLLAAIPVYAVELHWVATRGELVTWSQVFRGSADRPPYVHEGGRLLPNLDVRMRSAEYPYRGARLITDAAGLRNSAPVPRDPPAAELRILNLGDSFSVGYEIDQGAFFGARLESGLRSKRPKVRVLNAEISNPAHALYYLQNYGLAYRPRLVVLGLCGNDPMQAAEYTSPGGLFRFEEGRLVANPTYVPPEDPWGRYRTIVYAQPAPLSAGYLRQGTSPSSLGQSLGRFKLLLLLREPPREMPSIMYSYLLADERRDRRKRLFDGTANLGYYTVQQSPLAREHYQHLFEVLRAMGSLVKGAGARLVLMLFPQKFQVHPEEWEAMREYWGLRKEDFDLSLHEQRIRRFCEQNEIGCINPLADLQRAAREHPGRSLYMPLGDVHLNALGYKIAAQIAARQVHEELGRRRD